MPGGSKKRNEYQIESCGIVQAMTAWVRTIERLEAELQYKVGVDIRESSAKFAGLPRCDGSSAVTLM